MPAKIIYTKGQKIGKCIYIEEIERPDKHAWAKFICHCGREFIKRVDIIKRGKQKGCGCLLRASRPNVSSITHGMSKSNLYRVWRAMKNRCNRPNDPAFKNYGGRGINICEEWNNSFESFYRDMGEAPSKDHSLDRVDNSKGYYKENCRWATRVEQSYNRRSNVRFEYNGKMLSLVEWAAAMGVNHKALYHRINRGWPMDKIISQPYRESRQRKNGL